VVLGVQPARELQPAPAVEVGAKGALERPEGVDLDTAALGCGKRADPAPGEDARASKRPTREPEAELPERARERPTPEVDEELVLPLRVGGTTEEGAPGGVRKALLRRPHGAEHDHRACRPRAESHRRLELLAGRAHRDRLVEARPDVTAGVVDQPARERREPEPPEEPRAGGQVEPSG